MAEGVREIVELVPYWSFGLFAGAAIYGGTVWIGRHFREEFTEDLSRWLNGSFESSWSVHFGRLFDTVFGERHFSLKRVVRSAIASVLAVSLLYVLFAHVLGVMGARTYGQIGLWQALLIGAAVNILPDYLSLIETRWLLNQFGRVRTVLGQAALLLADLIFTAAIIGLAIAAYGWLFMGGAPSLVEVVALFSILSIFFYSTFLTSVWAWLYCLTSWFVRLFARLGLARC